MDLRKQNKNKEYETALKMMKYYIEEAHKYKELKIPNFVLKKINKCENINKIKNIEYYKFFSNDKFPSYIFIIKESMGITIFREILFYIDCEETEKEYHKLYIICDDSTTACLENLHKENTNYRKIQIYNKIVLQNDILHGTKFHKIIYPINQHISNDIKNKLPVQLYTDPVSRFLDLSINDVVTYQRINILEKDIQSKVYYHRIVKN